MSTRKPTNEQVASWVTKGTTTHADKVIVLYNDGETALVKWPSVSTGHSVFKADYCSPWVEKYKILKFSEGISEGQHVWDCSRTGDGPMTIGALRNLVHFHKLNEAYICYTRPKRGKQEAIRPRIKPKKERIVNLETRAVKVGMLVKGFKGSRDKIEHALETVKTVGEVEGIGDHIILMYLSLTDCMEFVKHDREKLLDELESMIC